MTFGLQCDEAQSRAILDRASDYGVSFIDTADGYPLLGNVQTVGMTEELLGRWLEGRLSSSATMPPIARERLNVAVDGIDAAIRDLRHYIFGLRPGLLANREFEAALRRMVAEVGADTDLHVDVDIDPVAAGLLSERAADVVQVALWKVPTSPADDGEVCSDAGAALLGMSQFGLHKGWSPVRVSSQV